MSLLPFGGRCCDVCGRAVGGGGGTDRDRCARCLDHDPLRTATASRIFGGGPWRPALPALQAFIHGVVEEYAPVEIRGFIVALAKGGAA